MITASERKLIGLREYASLPFGGTNYTLYSMSGHNVDSTSSWSNVSPFMDSHKLGYTLREAFGMEFYPGSLNVRTVHPLPWRLPLGHDAPKIRLGVFEISYVLPVILNEKCVCIVSAVNCRGHDPATGEILDADDPTMRLGDNVEMSQIYSPVNIRERLGLEDKEKTDDVPINARLLSGKLLTVKNHVNV